MRRGSGGLAGDRRLAADGWRRRYLSLFLVTQLPALAAEGEVSPFSWKATYEEGLEAAESGRRPLLVYFPPVRDIDEPAEVTQLPNALGAPPVIEGVRVSADEIVDLMGRFGVERLPAFVLLDRRQNVVARWQGGAPSRLVSSLLAAAARLRRKDEQDLRWVREAQRLAERGDPESAYRRVAPLLSSERTAPEIVKEASRVEKALLDELGRVFYRVLAREGFALDGELRQALEDLRSRTTHPGFRTRLDRELARLRSGTIGGR